MTRFFSTLCIFFVVMPLAYLHCSMADLAGGGTIETTNGRVTGTILHRTGDPASWTQVKLLPADYDPVKNTAAIPVDTTDSLGTYAFTHVAPGNYTVQAVHIDKRLRAFVGGIHIADDTVTVPAGMLQDPGAIKVMLPDIADLVHGYVYVPGSAIFTYLNGSTGFVTLDSVPAGVMPAVSYSLTSSSVSTVIRYDVAVSSGDTVIVWNPSWKYAQLLRLNTSNSGANIQGNVYNFPVLIRLPAGNFLFAHAKTGGADIRFAKRDNTSLPYEIERWDAVNQLAEIWVKVDTVYGNNDTQSITMYWGNAGAADSSNGAEVFDTADGWAGVWHLPEDAPDTVTAALYKNSVETANFGDDKVLSNGKTGIIGKGQNFTWSYGPSDIHADRIQVLNATSRLKPQQLTLSGWMQVFQSDSFGSEMASMGDNYLLRVDNFGHARFVIYSPSWPNNVTCCDSSADFADSSWHYYVGSYDGQEARLYVDGILCSAEPFTVPIDYSRGPDFVMAGHGTHKKGFNVYGNLDEINCSSIARSADWIRLMFENQKTNGVFISTSP